MTRRAGSTSSPQHDPEAHAAVQLTIVAGYYTDPDGAHQDRLSGPGEPAGERARLPGVPRGGPPRRGRPTGSDLAGSERSHRAGTDVPSLEDVAALAKVSTATVSRVLSDSSHPVAAPTRERVLAAAGALDFEPNMLARGLARSRTQTVAVLVHDMMDEYFSEIARGIEDEAYANGYVTLICNTDRDPAKELHYLRKLRAMQMDAIVFAAGGLRDERHRAEVDRQLVRIEAAGGVVVRLAPHDGGMADVGFSNTVGLRLAVDHLVELGHRSIGFLAGPAQLTTSAERLAAMRRGLKRHGIVLHDAAVVDGGFSREGGEAAAVAFVERGCPATAVVGANDQAAIGFVRGLRALGSWCRPTSRWSGSTTSRRAATSNRR